MFLRYTKFNPPPVDSTFSGAPFNPTSYDTSDIGFKDKPPSLLDQYKSINKNPLNEQLIQALGQAPNREDYKPNWKRRLVAGVAGAATGWNNPAMGAAVSQGMIDEPFNTANTDYQQRLNRLGIAAGINDRDIHNQLEGLRFGHDVENEDRRFNEGVREFDVTGQRQDKRDVNNSWEDYTNQNTGETVSRNRITGETKSLGKFGQSLDEKDSRELKKFGQEEGVRFGNASKLEGVRGGNDRTLESMREKAALTLEDKKQTGRMQLSQAKADSRIKELQSKSAGLKPGDKIKQLYANLIEAVSNGVDIDRYVDFSGTIPTIKYQGWFSPDENDTAIMNKLREAFKVNEEAPKSGGSQLPPGWR